MDLATCDNVVEDAAARSGMYRLLARLWLREVDVDLLHELHSPPISEAFLSAGGVLPPLDDDRAIEELAIDFCRLFVGPSNHLPPYQSVWQSGQFQSGTTVSMSPFIEVVGYDAERIPSGMMLDHLGVQFDVMGDILDQLSECREDADKRDALLSLAQTFFSRHLAWPKELLNAASHQAETEFYRSVIGVTRGFLGSER